MTEEAILKCLDILQSNISKSYFAQNVSVDISSLQYMQMATEWAIHLNSVNGVDKP